MMVVFIHGPAASGKHTIGTELAELMSIPLFHNHLAVDAAKTLFEFGTEPFTKLRAEIWRASFARAAEADQSFIFTFHPEASVDRALIDELVDEVASRGGHVYFVELQCSREAILDRLGNESRGKFGKLMDTELYEQIEASGGFDFPPLPKPILTIQTDGTAPTEAARQIHDVIVSKE